MVKHKFDCGNIIWIWKKSKKKSLILMEWISRLFTNEANTQKRLRASYITHKGWQCARIYNTEPTFNPLLRKVESKTGIGKIFSVVDFLFSRSSLAVRYCFFAFLLKTRISGNYWVLYRRLLEENAFSDE